MLTATQTASPAVKQLQQALTQLAVTAADSTINPGKIDGFVGTNTRTAVSQALRFIIPKIPTQTLRVAMTAASVALAVAPDADKYLRDYAAEITSAINMVLATTSPVNPPSPVAETPWYKTTLGKGGLIAGAGVLGLVLLLSRHRSPA